MLYGLWGDTLKVCSIFLKLKEVGVLQPPVCTLKPLWSPRIVMLPFDKETAHSCIHRAVCCISCAFTAWSCWTSHFPVPVRFCSDFHRQWLCFLLERTCYSSYVLTTAIISSLWVSGIKIMGKKTTDKSAAVSALLLPCIHICKKNNLFGVGHTACSETRQGLVAASSRKFSNWNWQKVLGCGVFWFFSWSQMMSLLCER